MAGFAVEDDSPADSRKELPQIPEESEDWMLVSKKKAKKEYAIPSAFEYYKNRCRNKTRGNRRRPDAGERYIFTEVSKWNN